MQNTIMNPLFFADFYKFSHYAQYPEGITEVYSNFTPRSNRLAEHIGTSFVVNAGLQGFIQSFIVEQFNEYFFDRDFAEIREEYVDLVSKSFCIAPEEVEVSHIQLLWDLGYLPIEIKALPEGALVPVKVPVFTIRNTHEDFAWVTNYIETVLSNDNWKSITNATIAFKYRMIMQKYAVLTGSPLDFVKWQGHDFSYRGLSGRFDAFNQVGHMFSFYGTDVVPVIPYLNAYYEGDKSVVVGGSVPASEHSVSSSNIINIQIELQEKGEYDGVSVQELEELLKV